MKKRYKILIALLPLIIAILSLGIGRFEVNFTTVVRILGSHLFSYEQTWTDMEYSVVMTVRLPRILLALLVGAALSISGAAFQGMFANPLVSADILGVAAGSGFGASIGILLFGTGYMTQFLALLFGLLAIVITYMIGGVSKNLPLFMLVLAGVVTSALFNALISLTKFVADPEEKLPSITYWLMGSLGTASYRDLFTSGPIILVGIIILLVMRWRINVLTLPDDEAKSLGVSVNKLKWMVIAGSTLCTAAAVSIAGIVGWVGLIIPHIARMMVGSNNAKVLPVSVALGGSYLLIIDTIARSVTATEIPLSILTAIIGAPFFAILLRKTGGTWS